MNPYLDLIVIIDLAVTLPITLYHHIRSQATREKLARGSNAYSS
jgi:hypothetical protein